MDKKLFEIPPRLDIINALVEGARDGMCGAVEVPFSAAEAFSAMLTLTAHTGEIMLALSPPDGYAYNHAQIMKGIHDLEARLALGSAESFPEGPMQ